jgi:hypothetical protein
MLWDKAPEAISKLLLATIGCKARGSALSAKKGLDVLQHASEPFLPPALTTTFSLNLLKLVSHHVAPGLWRVASKSVLKWFLVRVDVCFAKKSVLFLFFA